MKNYIFVGLGPHAKRIYYPFLEKHQAHYDLHIKLLIDLESQASRVSEYLDQRTLKPEKILYLPDNRENRMGGDLNEAAQRELDSLIKTEKIDGIIISTEPKAHKIYAEWALKNDINVLMDKPITAPIGLSTDVSSARQIYEDYSYLAELTKKSKAKFYVVCQRRNHAGYTFIKNYLKDFVTEYQIPISYIDIYHADGAWSLPHEFGKENHPYKYGYGKLMHSGYHFIDLFSWMTALNFDLERVRPDAVKLSTARFTPNDLFHQIDEKAQARFFNKPELAEFYKTYNPRDFDNFGELDAYILLQMKNNGRVVTTGSINLQQNSFSRRGWFDLPADTYKGNGRVRHERFSVQASQFLNIQVHSYQSYEVGKDKAELGNVGSEDHFDVYVFRNKAVIGGEAFAKYSFGKDMKEENKNDKYYMGHNEAAREATLLNFIEGKDDGSELKHHDLTNRLLSGIYESIAQDTNTGNSQLEFSL